MGLDEFPYNVEVLLHGGDLGLDVVLLAAEPLQRLPGSWGPLGLQVVDGRLRHEQHQTSVDNGDDQTGHRQPKHTCLHIKQ